MDAVIPRTAGTHEALRFKGYRLYARLPKARKEVEIDPVHGKTDELIGIFVSIISKTRRAILKR